MTKRLYSIWYAVALTAVFLLTACGQDYTSDIEALNDRQTSIDKRVETLEILMRNVNKNLTQLSVLTTAVEKGFYITEVTTTADGYELKLNNGHTFIWQKGPDNTLVPLPAVSITKISGFYFWTLNGQLLTDGNGRPLRTSDVTPVVKYDYVNMQWLVSVDGGVTFSNVNIFASTMINNTVLLEVINNYIREHSTTLISEDVLFQIITTYIQRNYAELFNIDQLNEIIVNHVRSHYTQIFRYELLEQIFNQYWTEYSGTHIDVDRLVNIIVNFIREHKEIIASNEVLYEIVNNYIEVNKTTIFSEQLLLEVINNFIETHEDYINVDVLRQVIFRYIEEHQDVIIDIDFIRNILVRFVEENYVEIFNQDILTQVINNYISMNQTTIFNETLIREVITNYVRNNITTIISNQHITEIINNYIERNQTTFINRELLIELVTNYFERNYNLFIDRTVITQLINNYIDTHKTTLIDVDIIRQIVSNYVERYYTEIFNTEMLTQIINNYISENTTIIRQYVSQYAGIITNVEADNEKATVTLRDGTAIQLIVYDQLATLRDRVQRIVVMPNVNGNITHSDYALRFRCVVTPASMANVIVDKYQSDEFELDVITSDGGGNITGTYHAEAVYAGEGMIDVTSSIYTAPALAAFVVKDKSQKHGTDFKTEFYVVDDGQDSQGGANLCPDDHHPHKIDLGLPSRTLWACCNVGAKSPEEYGGYYAWGETIGKSVYSASNYLLCNGSTSSLSKYCTNSSYGTVDNKKQLELHDDVAQGEWHWHWRMPTYDEIKELLDYCGSEWTSIKGVYGRKFTAHNGNSIFFPAAGYRYNSSSYSVGKYGQYWSSTVLESLPYRAYDLQVGPEEAKWRDVANRVGGQSVRAISDSLSFLSLSLSEHYLSLTVGQTATVKITSGSGSYSLKSSNTAVATASRSGNTISIKGIKAGTATITVTDTQTQQTATVTVEVKAATASLALSAYSMSINVGETGTITITSGSGSYSLKSSSTAVATASRSGSTISIKGIKAGSATITVTDTQTQQSKTISVTVKAVSNSLALSSYSLNIKVGGTATVTITSGSGSYSINNPDGNIVGVSKSGNTLTFTGKKAGSVNVKITDTQTQQTKTVTVTVTSGGAQAVDLGLPSGTKWASCNVGATKPEEYGDYYAWGETETKSDYSWNTYKWCNGTPQTLTKYCTSSSNGKVDNKKVLDASDDVARVKWGGSWRIPTQDEVEELKDKCSQEWITVNGVKGRKFTGPNGNSIFLPAAGYRVSSFLSGAGSDGRYWSSSLYESDPGRACNLYFLRKGVPGVDYGRPNGHSVRPVRSN